MKRYIKSNKTPQVIEREMDLQCKEVNDSGVYKGHNIVLLYVRDKNSDFFVELRLHQSQDGGDIECELADYNPLNGYFDEDDLEDKGIIDTAYDVALDYLEGNGYINDGILSLKPQK